MPKQNQKTKTSEPQHLAAVSMDGSPARTATEIKLWAALTDRSGATTAELARHAGIGLSTAGKILPRWHQAGHLSRATASVDGDQRRPPGTWTIASTTTTTAAPSQANDEPPADHRGTREATVATVRTPNEGDRPLNRSGTAKLRGGELLGLVEDCLRDRPGMELTPIDVARVLGRSGGAVRNCLDTLTMRGVAEQTHDKPRRFRLASSANDG